MQQFWSDNEVAEGHEDNADKFTRRCLARGLSRPKTKQQEMITFDTNTRVSILQPKTKFLEKRV